MEDSHEGHDPVLCTYARIELMAAWHSMTEFERRKLINNTPIVTLGALAFMVDEDMTKPYVTDVYINAACQYDVVVQFIERAKERVRNLGFGTPEKALELGSLVLQQYPQLNSLFEGKKDVGN